MYEISTHGRWIMKVGRDKNETKIESRDKRTLANCQRGMVNCQREQ